MQKNNVMGLKDKIWKLFDLLRNDIQTEDYSIVLLFIYLRAENLISEQLVKNSQPKHCLIDILSKTKDVNILSIYKVFLPSLKKLNEEKISLIVELLNTIDSDFLKKNLAKIYDDTLERIVLSQGRRSGEFVQPNQLTEFINSYIGSTKGLRVFNPFAGVASLIKDNKDSNSIYAQEINQEIWAIGQLRLIVNESSAVYKCEDSINNWPNDETFDLIVSNPPFRLRLNAGHRDKYPQYRNVEDFLLGMSVNSLSDNGQIIAVLPIGFLYNAGAEGRLREDLIQKDLIDTIVSFPGGLLHHTGIPFVIMILNKSKRYPEKIKLINAYSFISKPSTRESIIDVKELIKASKSTDSIFVRLISNQNVIENDFNLNIPRYFQEEIDGVRLKRILKDFRGDRRNLPDSGKFIRIRDLKNDNIDFQLNIDQVEESTLSRTGIYKIDRSCLLLAVRWKTLKPSYFHFNNEPIYNASDILPFIVDEDEVDINYLINELNADYVQQQLECFRQGATIPLIREADLLQVKIKLPLIEQQRAKVSGIKEISEKIKQLQIERNAISHGVSKKEFNEFASLKHTLGRPRTNILSWSKNLTKFFIKEEKAISSLNKEFRNFFDKGIVEAINEINHDIQFISDVLEKGENGLILKDYDRTMISLEEINKMINDISSNEFIFSIKKQLLDAEKMDKRGVFLNKVLLKTLIDNLLTNANKYGFEDKKDSNQVVIELDEIDDKLIIEVKNNGLPFPKNFDRQKFITKFKTADQSNGSGLGGYDINRIATYFENESWELEINNPIYPVIFRFSFSLKPIN